ncbi:YslB family protein [Lactobacillus xylocopicola]|uniref:DUF2507 domain-containing protein n=1 Tax=Lactobacillus xylocopicola TaxID=2976676 RepID=A0ABM8BFQ9_9LACO|nr:YslB family protein [Lactobacillus xylocopicola]BDR60089.1 hypothetical protein KIM322_03500 [Lactobacillus xylocopicola]
MQDSNQQNEHVYFVNQLYRDFLLPTILGQDNDEILYWAGKRVAQKYALASFEDVASFFATAEFGTLTQVKEHRAEFVFELSGQNVADRLNSNCNEFSLEAGIIAAALQAETNRITECEIKVDQRKQRVRITAQLD